MVLIFDGLPWGGVLVRAFTKNLTGPLSWHPVAGTPRDTRNSHMIHYCWICCQNIRCQKYVNIVDLHSGFSPAFPLEESLKTEVDKPLGRYRSVTWTIHKTQALDTPEIGEAMLRQSSRFLNESWVGWWNSPQSDSSTFAFWENQHFRYRSNSLYHLCILTFPDSNIKEMDEIHPAGGSEVVRYRKIGLDQLGTNTYRELDACYAGSTQLLLRMRSLLTVSCNQVVNWFQIWYFYFYFINNIKQHLFFSSLFFKLTVYYTPTMIRFYYR